MVEYILKNMPYIMNDDAVLRLLNTPTSHCEALEQEIFGYSKTMQAKMYKSLEERKYDPIRTSRGP